MKKTITLFVLFLGLGIANAQDKKPTKEETIEYITNKIDQLVYRLEEASSIGYTTYTYSNAQFKDCMFEVTHIMDRYLGSEGNVRITFVTQIPIDKIQKISVNYGVKFESYKNSKLIKESKKGVSNVYGVKKTINNEDHLSYDNLNMSQSDAEELTKAFNHLRKLCGAPEPISFD